MPAQNRSSGKHADSRPAGEPAAKTTPDWRAHFAWSEARGGPGLSVRLFRCTFLRPAKPGNFRVQVSADSRYRLWLNGEPVGFGPVKGSLARYYFDTYDLGSRLRPGRNVLAAEVRHFGENRPVASADSPVPGFLVQGPDGALLDTPGQWRVWLNEAVTPDTTAYIDNAQVFLNHLEQVDLRREPAGWRSPGFNDTRWPLAVATGPAADLGAPWGVAPLRTLYPRDIPLLRETPARFTRTIRDHVEVAHLFGARPAGWRLAAGAGGKILLDAAQYATGFPEFSFEGGGGREVRILYAEALGTWTEKEGERTWKKGDQRDDIANGDPHGYRDTLWLRGGEYQWEPFHWRTFRYIQIEILPGPEPVAVSDVSYRLCVYPQQFSARFEANDPVAEQIFAVSLRTLLVGAHDNYDDSPYFEQLSYIADTRLEALGSLHLANETALPRRNLRLFLDTLRADGLLDARVPSQYARQTIPYFCLHWILMLEDYWRWVGAADRAFVQEALVAVDTILLYFRARLRPDGFVGVTGGWNMVDRAPDWPKGVPPAVAAGGSTYLTSLYVEAMQAAARLHEGAGWRADARRWKQLSSQLKPKVRSAAWDEKSSLFWEGAERRQDRRSHHSQAGAVNAGIATPAQARRIVRRLWADNTLIRSHSMQSYYVARALERAGAYGDVHEHLLRAWRIQLSQGLTTWSEYPDPTRSDSHAWAAWPAVDYVTKVLGIEPAAPGWPGVRLAPQVAGLGWARGEAPSPAGPIGVSWEKAHGELHFSAQVPAGLPAEVRLPRAQPRHFPQGGAIRLTVRL